MRSSLRVPIRDLPFRHNLKPGLGFELFRLSDLFARADRKAIDHALDTPQRPEFHTLYIGLRGRGSLIVDFTRVPLGAGTLTLVARGRVQQFVPDRSVDAWMLLFAPEFVEPGATTIGLLSPMWAVPAIALPGDDRRDLLALCDQLDVEHARPLDAVQPALLGALLRVVLLRAERLGRFERPPSGLERFFTILERDCMTTRSVAHYAKGAGISPRRLGELLGEHLGRSTKQVIDERVVLEIKRLLAHTNLSVKELADRAGFAEPTNLAKFFRHHTSQTPLEFRAASRFLPSRRRS
jgi:AraC-like DNA-binding protein